MERDIFILTVSRGEEDRHPGILGWLESVCCFRKTQKWDEITKENYLWMNEWEEGTFVVGRGISWVGYRCGSWGRGSRGWRCVLSWAASRSPWRSPTRSRSSASTPEIPSLGLLLLSSPSRPPPLLLQWINQSKGNRLSGSGVGFCDSNFENLIIILYGEPTSRYISFQIKYSFFFMNHHLTTIEWRRQEIK